MFHLEWGKPVATSLYYNYWTNISFITTARSIATIILRRFVLIKVSDKLYLLVIECLGLESAMPSLLSLISWVVLLYLSSATRLVVSVGWIHMCLASLATVSVIVPSFLLISRIMSILSINSMLSLSPVLFLVSVPKIVFLIFVSSSLPFVFNHLFIVSFSLFAASTVAFNIFLYGILSAIHEGLPRFVVKAVSSPLNFPIGTVHMAFFSACKTQYPPQVVRTSITDSLLVIRVFLFIVKN